MFHNEKFQNVQKNKFLHFKEHFGIWYNVGCLDQNRLISLPYKLLTIIVTNRDHMAPYEPLRPTTDHYGSLRTAFLEKTHFICRFFSVSEEDISFFCNFLFFILSQYGCGISLVILVPK